MRLTDWQKGALIASIVWAIPGFYCGMHFPVAPAIRAYERCLRQPSPPVNDCYRAFEAEWKVHSPERVYSGLALALIPIPLVGFVLYAARDRFKVRSKSPDYLASLMP
jgi:hypothetical protein